MALETGDSIPGRDSKNGIDTALLNTQKYKVLIKCKVERSRERSSAVPFHLSVVAFEKEALRPPSTRVTNFTNLIILICLLTDI